MARRAIGRVAGRAGRPDANGDPAAVGPRSTSGGGRHVGRRVRRRPARLVGDRRRLRRRDDRRGPIPTLFAGVAGDVDRLPRRVLRGVAAVGLAATRSRTTPSAARAVDVVGLPIGVAHPARARAARLRPAARRSGRTRSPRTRLSETAEKLADRASGGTMVLLVLMVCVGAPIVEEIVYRGPAAALVRRPHVARRRLAGRRGVVHAHPLPARRVPRACSSSRSSTGACLIVHRPPRHVDRDARRVQRHRPAAGRAMGLDSDGRCAALTAIISGCDG